MTSPKSKQNAPDRRRTLALKPVRNPNVEWELAQKEGPQTSVIIKIPLQRRPTPKAVVWIASKLARKPPSDFRRIELDAIGSFVWHKANGGHSVRELIWLLAVEHSLNRKDAEVALLEFLRQLSARDLMGFANIPNR